MTTVSSSFLDHKIFLKTILLAQAKTLPVGLGSTTVAANDLTGLSDLLASTNHVLQVTLQVHQHTLEDPQKSMSEVSMLEHKRKYTHYTYWFYLLFFWFAFELVMTTCVRFQPRNHFWRDSIRSV